ncbi:hypothetical protein OSTOST_19369 [Ostertagia ostertagi]
MRGEDRGFEKALDWILPEGCRQKPRPSNSSGPLSVGKTPSRASTTITTVPERSVQQTTEPSQDPTKVNRVPNSNNNPEKARYGKSDPVTVRLPPAPKTPKNIAEPVEAALIIDGEIRTLRYQLLDWQGNPVAPPDFENLARIMTLQLLPFKFPIGRPQETVVLPSEEDEKAAERRVEERITRDDKEEKEKFDEDWQIEDGPEITTNDGIGVAIGLIVFAATVFYWALGDRSRYLHEPLLYCTSYLGLTNRN